MNFKLLILASFGSLLACAPQAIADEHNSGPEPYSFHRKSKDLSILEYKPEVPYVSEKERKEHIKRIRQGPD